MPERQITVTTTVQQALAYNKDRTTWIMHNRGTVEAFVSQDRSAVVSGGFPLLAGGFVGKRRRDGEEARRAVFVAVAATTTDVRISEEFGDLPEDRLLRALEARS